MFHLSLISSSSIPQLCCLLWFAPPKSNNLWTFAGIALLIVLGSALYIMRSGKYHHGKRGKSAHEQFIRLEMLVLHVTMLIVFILEVCKFLVAEIGEVVK